MTDRRKEETKLQGAIVDAIRKLFPRVEVMRTHAGGRRVPRGYIHLQRKGWPDLTMCAWGAFACIEVKLGGEDLDDAQVVVRDELLRAGAYHTVARSVHDAVAFLHRIRSEQVTRDIRVPREVTTCQG